MQGYMLNVAKVKNEDCIVSIITPQRILRCYRFYGARHSNIIQGYKLDFEIETSLNFLPRLKNVLHLGFPYLLERNLLLKWQELTRLFWLHLRDLNEIDEFYFELLEKCGNKFSKQNPKRVVVEAYLEILEFEGRKHSLNVCYFCGEKLSNEICLTRGFLPSHFACSGGAKFNFTDIAELFKIKSAINLSDDEITTLYGVILEGF